MSNHYLVCKIQVSEYASRDGKRNVIGQAFVKNGSRGYIMRYINGRQTASQVVRRITPPDYFKVLDQLN